MCITIKEVKSKRDLKSFISFYTHLYSKNTEVAFPLHFDELKTLNIGDNPAHDFCTSKYWLAYDGKKVVGRIAAIINIKEQLLVENKIGRFGWFDFIDNHDVSKKLIEVAVEWFHSKDVNTIHGPLGFTDMDRQGLLIEGFEYPGTMATIYNFPYYRKHIESLGFTKSIDWVEYFITPEEKGTRRLSLMAERCLKMNGLKSLKLSSRKELKKRANEIFDLINDTYSDLYGYIPLNEKQKQFYTNAYLSFVNPKLISLVEDSYGKLVGVGITMPSFTKALQKSKGKLFPFGFIHMLRALKKNDCLDLYLIGVDKKYQNKGVNSIIMTDIIEGARELGIFNAETNIELENNTNVQSMWRFIPNKQHKRRRCYIKEI